MTKQITVTYDDFHPCSGYDDGGFWTTQLFWDCECVVDFIHPKSTLSCDKCGAVEEDGQPDSRVTEVLEHGIAVDVVIPLNEAFNTVMELAEQNALDFSYAQCEGAGLIEEAFIQDSSLKVVQNFLDILENYS